MENDIYFEGVYISYQTISLFEEMYENKKQEIMNDLKKKHNSNSNNNSNIYGRELSENTRNSKTEYNHTTTRE